MRTTVLLLAIGLAGCASKDIAVAKTKCEKFGFAKDGPEFPACVERAANILSQRRSAALMGLGAALQGQSAARNAEPAPSSRGFYVRDFQSGMNKICVYNSLGNGSYETVSAVSACPR